MPVIYLRQPSGRGITSEVAQRSRDTQIVAYALINHASIRTDLGGGTGVLDMCSAVFADASRLAPKLRVMALQQQAHALPSSVTEPRQTPRSTGPPD